MVICKRDIVSTIGGKRTLLLSGGCLAEPDQQSRGLFWFRLHRMPVYVSLDGFPSSSGLRSTGYFPTFVGSIAAMIGNSRVGRDAGGVVGEAMQCSRADGGWRTAGEDRI